MARAARSLSLLKSPAARHPDLLAGFRPADRRGDGPHEILAVVLHGWRGSAARMGDVAEAVADALRPDGVVDLLVPDLPHGSMFSVARSGATVQALLAAIDRVVERHGPYRRIVLVGHGIGATLARRLFLTAVGPLEEFHAEAPLRHEPPRAWAARVERIVLIAAVNRGWALSERVSWSYALLFNTVGLVGNLMPRQDWAPAIFDYRLGAPFVVQTRLHWLAYRRHSDRDRTGPLLIQVIGSRDDLVSPFDQVDIAVDGLDQDVQADNNRCHVTEPAQRSLYLLRMAETGHNDAIDLRGPLGDDAASDAASRAVAAARRDVLMLALGQDRHGLDADPRVVDPDLLSDQVARPDSAVERAVFVVHGIRDDGFWTHRIAEAIRSAGGATCGATSAFRSWTPTYGYFAMLPFLLPWIRRNKVEWLMDQYVSAAAQYPKAAFDYVGHSNGTYLGARALRDYADCRFHHVFFAGSVVRGDFAWGPLIDQGRVGRLMNVVATADWVVALLPKSVEWWPAVDLGGAGFDGFADAASRPELMEHRYVAGGHAAGIVEGHWDDIAGFIVDGRPLTPRPAVPALFGGGQPPWLRRLADLRIVVAALVVALVGVVPALVLHWTRHAPASLPFLVLVLYAALVGFIVTRL